MAAAAAALARPALTDRSVFPGAMSSGSMEPEARRPLSSRRLKSPMSSLKDRVTEDMKAAMRAKDAERLGTIRMITSAIKQREVDERIQLDDTQVLAVIEKMIKMRKESIAQFQSGGREDLVAKEQKEIDLLQVYMPQQLSEAELDALIAQSIAEAGATSIKEMGKAMALLKQKAQGRADMAAASAKLKAKLGG